MVRRLVTIGLMLVLAVPAAFAEIAPTPMLDTRNLQISSDVVSLKKDECVQQFILKEYRSFDMMPGGRLFSLIDPDLSPTNENIDPTYQKVKFLANLECNMYYSLGALR